jgi:hypothetical protein
MGKTFDVDRDTHTMNTREFFLCLAILPILLLPAGVHAVPILHLNATGPASEIHFPRYNDAGINHPEADEMLAPVNRLWSWDVGGNHLLSGNYSDGFGLPYGFGSLFAAQLLGSNLASLALLDIFTADVTRVNGDSESSGDADEIADFLATLGIAMEDWLITEENPHTNSQSDPLIPAPFNPAITRHGLGECLQQQRPGVRENLCPQGGGLAGTGGRGGAGAAGIGGGGLGFGSPGKGVNPGIGGIGGGSGGGGGSSGPGTGSNGPDIGGNGPGTGDGGSGGGGDDGNVVTVPEPTTLALIGFGIAGMCTVRRRRN